MALREKRLLRECTLNLTCLCGQEDFYHSFILSSLIDAYCMPGTVLGTRNTPVKKNQKESLSSRSLHSEGRNIQYTS